MSQLDGRVTILPPIALSPRAARDFTYDALADWRLTSAACEETVLVVDELVTHAVRHASGPISVLLTLIGHNIHVEVTQEHAEDLPEPVRDQNGPRWGALPAVAALSSGWGTVRRKQGGETLWADVATDSEALPTDQ